MKKEMDRFAQMKLNSVWAMVLTILTFISGFIIPNLIIKYYGSSVNGLVNSINQFLQVFTLLELGVAGVTRSALYGPVAQKNEKEISKIVSSASNFYRGIGIVLLVYVLVLVVIYPSIINNEFDFRYTTIMLLSYSIGMFAQYYFGMVDNCILGAYQKTYISSAIQSIAVTVNVILTYVMIFWGFSIYAVKIMTAVIYLIRPLLVRGYIQHYYKIKRNEKYDVDPISQKWNGIAQHLSFVVLQSADTVILTVYTSLSNVSVYAVYNMIIVGLNSLITALLSGLPALLGNIYAKNERELFHSFFRKMEWSIHCIVVLIFGCTTSLIIPFIKVYTNGVTDINYVQPVFSILFTIANAWFSMRYPYAIVMDATGRYKETQKIFVIAAIINVVISIALVNSFGLVGIAIGTLIAMCYQTLELAKDVVHNVLNDTFVQSVKLFVVDMMEIIVIYIATGFFNLTSLNYLAWIWMATKVFICSVGIIFIIQMIFYREQLVIFYQSIKNRNTRN